MVPFATEFPLEPGLDRASFLAEVMSWLRGTRYSRILDEPNNTEFAGDSAILQSQNGEELRLREFGSNGSTEAIGFRYDFPDESGRLWRTEAVVRRAASEGGQDLVRLRTQCIAREPGVRLDTPRKPYLIKSLLRDGLGGIDNGIRISDRPHWLDDSELSLETAIALTRGQASQYLPAIYVSAVGTQRWLPSQDQIEKLAYDLGGIAHVIVEPSRAFSFRLRDLSEGENAYGGTLAIALPERGIVRRYFTGLRLTDVDDLLAAVRAAAIAIRSQMPAKGWDWTELQEQALRYQRERDRRRLSDQETIALYEEEVANLKDRIGQLEAQISSSGPGDVDQFDEGLLPDQLVKKLGPEIYPGEFSDRIRLAIRDCAARADQIGLGSRSKAVLAAIGAHLPVSPALTELIDDLKRATKDAKRIGAELTTLLTRHGYREKSDNKHIRLQARDGYDGLDAITLPKTPSDQRGLLNLRKQIERTLGLGKLSD